jgi:hypothetical protein
MHFGTLTVPVVHVTHQQPGARQSELVAGLLQLLNRSLCFALKPIDVESRIDHQAKA